MLKNLRYILFNIFVIFIVTLIWWILKTDKRLIEFLESLMWAGGINIFLGGLMLIGSQTDAWSDGGIVDLNENYMEARIKRFEEVQKTVVIFIVSGAIVVSTGYLMWKFIGGTI